MKGLSEIKFHASVNRVTEKILLSGHNSCQDFRSTWTGRARQGSYVLLFERSIGIAEAKRIV